MTYSDGLVATAALKVLDLQFLRVLIHVHLSPWLCKILVQFVTFMLFSGHLGICFTLPTAAVFFFFFCFVLFVFFFLSVTTFSSQLVTLGLNTVFFFLFFFLYNPLFIIFFSNGWDFFFLTLCTTLIYNTTLVRLLTQFTTIIQLQITNNYRDNYLQR